MIAPPEKPKIGALWNDGVVMPTPPVRRALRVTVEKLRAAGHEVVDWDSKGHAQAAKIIVSTSLFCHVGTDKWKAKMFLADGGKTIRKSLETSGEPWQPQMIVFSTATELGVYDMWQVQRERTDLCKMYMDRWNACEGLDAILSMGFPLNLQVLSHREDADLSSRSNNSIHFSETWRLASYGVSFLWLRKLLRHITDCLFWIHLHLEYS